jgi:hypothetical protein
MWSMLWREHRRGWRLTAAIGMAVLGGLVITFGNWGCLGVVPEPVLSAVAAGFAMVAAAAYGILVGTRLPAGGLLERRTVSLPLWPRRRVLVWLGQALIGAAFVLSLAAFLTGGVCVVVLLNGGLPSLLWSGLIALAALTGYSWALGGATLALTRESCLPISLGLMVVAGVLALGLDRGGGTTSLIVTIGATVLFLDLSPSSIPS